MEEKKKFFSAKRIATLGTAIAISYLTTLLSFPLFPGTPAFFLELDFSFAVMLLTGYILGPISSLIIVVITNLLGMIGSTGGITGAVANTGREEYKRVVVDCENYRENREATLNKLSENLAQKAIRMGKKIKLEPMNPYERRIIHAALSEKEGVSTVSEGKEPNRYIVIIPDNLEDPDAPAIPARNERGGRNGGRGYNRGGNRGNRGGYNNRGGKSFDKKPYNRDRKPSSDSATGGTTMKASNDFFGIFLGNSGNKDDI